MKDNNYLIRRETEADYRNTEYLVRESFWNVYRPGCLEHYLLHCLRNDADFVQELDFVMEKDGKIIGQNVFVRTVIKADDGRDIPIMTMGPICIASELKRKGYGKILLDYSLEKAKEFGCGAVCFEGNIDYLMKVNAKANYLPEDYRTFYYKWEVWTPDGKPVPQAVAFYEKNRFSVGLHRHRDKFPVTVAVLLASQSVDVGGAPRCRANNELFHG